MLDFNSIVWHLNCLPLSLVDARCLLFFSCKTLRKMNPKDLLHIDNVHLNASCRYAHLALLFIYLIIHPFIHPFIHSFNTLIKWCICPYSLFVSIRYTSQVNVCQCVIAFSNQLQCFPLINAICLWFLTHALYNCTTYFNLWIIQISERISKSQSDSIRVKPSKNQ